VTASGASILKALRGSVCKDVPACGSSTRAWMFGAEYMWTALCVSRKAVREYRHGGREARLTLWSDPRRMPRKSELPRPGLDRPRDPQ
jgi:hypothetical protein